MRRDALYGERPGDPYLAPVFMGFVIQVFVIGVGGDAVRDSAMDQPALVDLRGKASVSSVERSERLEA